MRIFTLLLLLMASTGALAQNFSPLDTINIDNMARPTYEWVDLDNDGRLDIFVTGEDLSVTDSSRSLTVIFQQLPDTTFVLVPTDLETFGTQFYRFADMNKDGRQDIVMAASGGDRFEHVVFENQGDFTWEKQVLELGDEVWEELRLADLNNDGTLELITSTADSLLIYTQGELIWEKVLLADTLLSTLATDPVVLDHDKDGFVDLLLTGVDSEDDSVSVVLNNQQDFEFNIASAGLDSLSITDYVVRDFNDDGLPDLLLNYQTADTNRSVRLHLGVEDALFMESQDTSRLAMQQAHVFAADLGADGKLDTDLEGFTLTDNELVRQRVLKTLDSLIFEQDTLMNSSGRGRRYGDFDFDGDLDFFEMTSDARGSKLWLFENEPDSVNVGANGLADLLTFRLGEQFYIVWNQASDDNTATNAVTYDVALGSTETGSDILAGGFDPTSLRRTIVGPGNQGQNDFLILCDAPTTEFFVSIMALDNAFHYDISQCIQGGIGGAGTCDEELVVQNKVLCDTDEITLRTATGEEARWFSASEGYLGKETSLDLVVTARDTVVAIYNRVDSCIDGEVFALIPGRGELVAIPDQTVCEGDMVSVSTEDIWSEIQWTSANDGLLSNTAELSYVPTANDLVTLSVIAEEGCSFQETFSVNVATVIAQVQDTVVTITEGDAAQLVAFGGTQYRWEPTTGLSNPEVANPQASPQVTTEYTVSVFNDFGCVDQTTVLVMVIPTAFAPDVFSPNGDARNETYLIYDLDNVGEFVFSIFDRSGNKVFESSDLTEVTFQGWDGTKGGSNVPPGTYYWRIRGNYADGQTILINGSQKGALQLVR